MVIDSITVPNTPMPLKKLSPKFASGINGELRLQASEENDEIIFVGNADVSPTKGYELLPGEVLPMDTAAGLIWVMCATGEPRLNIAVQER